jgi:hypothetical protein
MHVTTLDIVAEPTFEVTTSVMPGHDYRRIHVNFAPGTSLGLSDTEAERLAVALAEGIVKVRAQWAEAELAADNARIAARDAELDGEQDEPDFGGDGP